MPPFLSSSANFLFIFLSFVLSQRLTIWTQPSRHLATPQRHVSRSGTCLIQHCESLFTSVFSFLLGLTHTPMCVISTFPESCEKRSQAYYLGGIRTHKPCNSRTVSYQLDYWDCPVARGRSNLFFLSCIKVIFCKAEFRGWLKSS